MEVSSSRGAVMRALVVYESQYGNTHQVAEAIGEALCHLADVDVVSIHDAGPELVGAADLLVVGAPTHVHGMSRPSTRTAAADAVPGPAGDLALDPSAAGDGVREWLESLAPLSGRAAAFDTRVDMAAVVTGRASKAIAKELRRHGLELVCDPESFLVTKQTHLVAGELERAHAWGRRLGTALSDRPPSSQGTPASR
jgi:hypothetical protein